MSQSLGKKTTASTMPCRFQRMERVVQCLVLLSIVVWLLGTSFRPVWDHAMSHPAENAYRSSCKQHLKQIGVALESYHQRYGCFPPAYVADNQGRPMHSWRMLILPYLGEGWPQELYDKYRFDEPWNGPNNGRLAEFKIEPYCCPSEGRTRDRRFSTMTSYVAVVGPETAWPGATPTRRSDFCDSATATVLVVETVNSGIHWMEPRDLDLSLMAPKVNAEPGPAISSKHRGGAHALFADGGVRVLDWKTPVEELRGALTRDGGEPPINLEWIR